MAVRCPARAHVDRVPDRAVLGVAVPAAEAVEFFGTRHLGRDVGVGRGALFVAPVFGDHAVGELVGRQAVPRVAQLAGFVVAAGAFAPQLGALAGGDGEAEGVLDAQVATPDAREGAVVGAVDAVVAGTLRRQAHLLGDDLDLFGLLARLHPQRQAAAVKLEHQAFVVDALKFELGAAAQPQHGGTDAQLGAALWRGGQAVAGGQRAVALGVVPLAAFGVVPGDPAARVGQAADAARRVFLCRGRHRDNQRGGKSKCSEKAAHGRTTGAAAPPPTANV